MVEALVERLEDGLDLAALGEAVKWEVSRGGALFPHIYGPLPMEAVRGVRKAA